MTLPSFSHYTNAELIRYVDNIGGTTLEKELAQRLDEVMVEIKLIAPQNDISLEDERPAE